MNTCRYAVLIALLVLSGCVSLRPRDVKTLSDAQVLVYAWAPRPACQTAAEFARQNVSGCTIETTGGRTEITEACRETYKCTCEVDSWRSLMEAALAELERRAKLTQTQ